MNSIESLIDQNKGRPPKIGGDSHLTTPWLLRSCPGAKDSVQDSVIMSSPFGVGRKSESDLCISDPTVSGSHADLFFVEDDLFVRDLDSTNETFVNGQRVGDRRRP